MFLNLKLQKIYMTMLLDMNNTHFTTKVVANAKTHGPKAEITINRRHSEEKRALDRYRIHVSKNFGDEAITKELIAKIITESMTLQDKNENRYGYTQASDQRTRLNCLLFETYFALCGYEDIHFKVSSSPVDKTPMPPFLVVTFKTKSANAKAEKRNAVAALEEFKTAGLHVNEKEDGLILNSNISNHAITTSLLKKIIKVSKNLYGREPALRPTASHYYLALNL